MNTVVAIAAEFDKKYIHEWLDWYLFVLDFDQAVIFMNNWSLLGLDVAKYFEKGKKVILVRCDGTKKQLSAYNFFISLMSDGTDWAAFFDIDEFLYFKNDNITNFLFNYNEYPALAVNWKLAGSSGIQKRDNVEVIPTFTNSQVGVNKHIKTILNLKGIRDRGYQIPLFVTDPHHTNYIAISPEEKLVYGPFNYDGSDKNAYIMHYIIKSKKEFFERRSQPRADCGIPRTDLDEFLAEHDKNDVKNTDLVKKIKNCCRL